MTDRQQNYRLPALLGTLALSLLLLGIAAFYFKNILFAPSPNADVIILACLVGALGLPIIVIAVLSRFHQK